MICQKGISKMMPKTGTKDAVSLNGVMAKPVADAFFEGIDFW